MKANWQFNLHKKKKTITITEMGNFIHRVPWHYEAANMHTDRNIMLYVLLSEKLPNNSSFIWISAFQTDACLTVIHKLKHKVKGSQDISHFKEMGKKIQKQ